MQLTLKDTVPTNDHKPMEPYSHYKIIKLFDNEENDTFLKLKHGFSMTSELYEFGDWIVYKLKDKPTQIHFSGACHTNDKSIAYICRVKNNEDKDLDFIKDIKKMSNYYTADIITEPDGKNGRS